MKRLLMLILILYCALPQLCSQILEWHIKDNNYIDIKYLGNNLFKVKTTDGKWGVINEYGAMSVEARYDSITHLVENRALLLDLTGQELKGIINEQGHVIATFNSGERLANYPYFKEGLLAYGIPTEKYYMFGYLDIYGNPNITPQYYWAAPFSDGKAVVQYRSGNFGLINKTGKSALNDNRKIKFMSTPVNGKLLVAVNHRKGEKLILAELTNNGTISDGEDLESGTIINHSSDYKRVSCQNGYTYYLDNAMRLMSSSRGRTFNNNLSDDNIIFTNSVFRKIKGQKGWNILYSGKMLLQSRNVTFAGNEFVIVNTYGRNFGVLKLNKNGNLNIQSVSGQAEFYHNVKSKGNIAVNISGMSSSKVEIGVSGLNGNNQENKFNVPNNHNGIYNQEISYFIPSTEVGKNVEMPIKVTLYVNGMLQEEQEYVLAGVHKRGFRISELTAPQFSEADGSANISFKVQSLESSPSSSATVIVSGAANISKKFNGNKVVYISIPVRVPDDLTKTYSFTISVKEDGCPTYTRTMSKTISHYHLQ